MRDYRDLARQRSYSRGKVAIGIGLFLLLIAANGVGMVIKNPIEGLPVALGAFTSFLTATAGR